MHDVAVGFHTGKLAGEALIGLVPVLSDVAEPRTPSRWISCAGRPGRCA